MRKRRPAVLNDGNSKQIRSGTKLDKRLKLVRPYPNELLDTNNLLHQGKAEACVNAVSIVQYHSLGQRFGNPRGRRRR